MGNYQEIWSWNKIALIKSTNDTNKKRKVKRTVVVVVVVEMRKEVIEKSEC